MLAERHFKTLRVLGIFKRFTLPVLVGTDGEPIFYNWNDAKKKMLKGNLAYQKFDNGKWYLCRVRNERLEAFMEPEEFFGNYKYWVDFGGIENKRFNNYSGWIIAENKKRKLHELEVKEQLKEIRQKKM